MHRALDGAEEMPIEYVIGRFCEEFHCLPSAALREWLNLPVGFMETILEYRTYSRAKAAYDSRGQSRHDPPLTDLVIDNDFRIVQDGLAAR